MVGGPGSTHGGRPGIRPWWEAQDPPMAEVEGPAEIRPWPRWEASHDPPMVGGPGSTHSGRPRIRPWPRWEARPRSAHGRDGRPVVIRPWWEARDPPIVGGPGSAHGRVIRSLRNWQLTLNLLVPVVRLKLQNVFLSEMNRIWLNFVLNMNLLAENFLI